MSYQGVQTVSDAELGVLLPLATDRRVLELGSWLGWSTRELCRVATQVWSVDWHHDQAALQRRKGGPAVRFSETDLDTLYSEPGGWTLPRFSRRLARESMDGKLVTVVARTAEALPLLRPASFDLIFQDADHTADGVALDLRLALPTLRWDGWVAVHDWGRWGVTEGSVSVLGHPDHVEQTLAVWGPNRGRWHI